LLLVDPIRYFRIFDVTYHFWKSKLDIPELDKTPCFLESQEQYTITDGKKDKQPAQKDQSRHQQPLERFIALMMQVTPPQAANSEPRRLIQGVFAQLMCEDLPPILGKMALALKQIELSLHDDRVLQKSIHVWRRQLGRWRNTLFHQSEQLRDLSLDFLMPGETAESTQDTLHSRLDRLATTVDRASRRVESDFQALMSSMSIVESERAIAEAEVVSKLTHLAFFFIPLSLVAGVFGMNIIVSRCDPLTWVPSDANFFRSMGTPIQGIGTLDVARVLTPRRYRNSKTNSPGGTGWSSPWSPALPRTPCSTGPASCPGWACSLLPPAASVSSA